ncbi:hypothetical protein [Nodosilinea sp. E11]|uniref:hypothetical protein n=1 Tax=Nodosilinea sp. E11 TaxID=3037479 RepID=UPI00293452DC|nr:hypothetical protein [Nodosilinea sp. E11]WOD41558.1 hypothetical protein RRF56_12205 [Nodosilinea sp. E11]
MKPQSLYAQLELIPEPLPTRTDYSLGRVWAAVQGRLGWVGRRLFDYLCGSTDLRVTVRRSRAGKTLFVVHDPVGQQRHTFSSEQDLRAWADQRYYP